MPKCAARPSIAAVLIERSRPAAATRTRRQNDLGIRTAIRLIVLSSFCICCRDAITKSSISALAPECK